jgi:hypothetical protein
LPVAREYKANFDVNSTKMNQARERSKVTKKKEGGIKNLLNCWERKWKWLQKQLRLFDVGKKLQTF